MVAVDGPYNSWRNLLLPFAQTNDLVMDAVLSVAVYHYNTSHFPNALEFPLLTTGLPDPNELQGRVICGLQQQGDLAKCDSTKKHAVLLTILVLIVGAMVTEGSDYPYLFRMLESALLIVGGEAELGICEVSAFLMAQIHKYVENMMDHGSDGRTDGSPNDRLRVYSAPLLDETTGLLTISSPVRAAELLRSLSHRLSHYPEHSVVLGFVTDLVRQAFGIYLEQFSHMVEPTEHEVARSISRVQHFIETLEAFPANAPGEQVLIWASFVAGSGCLLPEHKASTLR